MEYTVEVCARNVEDAVREGVEKLGVKQDNVKVEIINEASQGILKILGAKPAKVKLTVRKKPDEYMKDIFENLMQKMMLNAVVSVKEKEDESICLDIEGKELGVLIGKRGNTLNALQYLANVIYHRQFSFGRGRILVDVENYRKKRKKTLEQLARNLAVKAMNTKSDVTLEPMTAQERRIIHLALKNHKDVITYSQGEEPFRNVVISPR